MTDGTPAGLIVQLSVSPGGLPKRAVPEARVTALGLEGDGQRNLRHHGGPERAVCLFPLEAITALAAEGHAIVPGALGENVTTVGVDWSRIQPGARVLLGQHVLLEVTKYTSPCVNLAPLFREGDFGRVSQKRHPGWSRVYARVLAGGRLRAGDPVRVVSASEAADVLVAP